MNTETDVCNYALSLVGDEEIQDLLGDSKSQRLCRQHYYQVRNFLLEQYYWKFALKRVDLSEDVTPPAFEWGNQFIIPSDFCQVYRLYPRIHRYEIEGLRLLCNEESLGMKYVYKVTDVTLFPSFFVESLAFAMAIRLAWPLNQSNNLVSRLQAQFDNIIKDARMANAILTPPPQLIDDTFLNSRMGGSYTEDGFNE